MDLMISRFSAQLREALEIADKAMLNHGDEEIQNALIAGMGGSGIGGDFLVSFVRKESNIPIVVNKSYDIPNFVSKNTLAICSSYSGNTEETLAAFDAIEQTGAKIVCIASGGKIIALAKEKNYDYIQVPDNWASPRACLGYSIVQQVCIFTKLGLISSDTIHALRGIPAMIDRESEAIKKEAKEIAGKLLEKIPIIYIEDSMEPVGIRFRQQINENSKMLCWHHVIPEMNHNELVGWKEKQEDVVVLFLRSESDFERNKIRMDINKEIISNLTDTVIEIYSKGSNMIERTFYLIHLVDWISYYLSQMNGVDSIEVEVIDYLKKELSKFT